MEVDAVGLGRETMDWDVRQWIRELPRVRKGGRNRG
jgi:hypothetical protein